MNLKKNYRHAFLFLLLLFVFTGCGGGNKGGIPATKTKGYLIDSALQGISYICDGNEALTDARGMFECIEMPVTFKVGQITLGTINSLNTDKKVYLQDLLGLDRDNYSDEELKLLARFIQSLDDDGDISTKITITKDIRQKMSSVKEFNHMNKDEVKTLLNKVGKEFVSEESAIAHLEGSPNIAPVAKAQVLTVDEDTRDNSITLEGTDVDGNPLTYTIVTQPTHGTLTLNGAVAKYTPSANYYGADSFSFKVNDGTIDSVPATVTIAVKDVAEPNVAPVAKAQAIAVDEDTTNNAITLEGTDVDGNSLTYAIVTEPTHGTLTLTGAVAKYTPTANYYGADSFSFKVNDGTADSAPATVTIAVKDVVDSNITTNIATVYEDAENNTTNNWSILSNYSGEANITNTYDDERKTRVIYLQAKVRANNSRSYDTFKFNGINSKKNNKFIQWSMKFDQIFAIGINIKSKNGGRWLYYIAKDTGAGVDSNYPDSIVHGIGSDKTNNKWHTITRDLQRDLKRYEPDNEFIEINYMTIRGGGSIDNIVSYASEDNLDVNKPVIISQPGVVLTFDDSHASNWNKMQETFKEKGARATFFCNRWADTSENWDITKEEEAIFKSFQDNGHEIGFHTVGHLSTRDKKYDNEPNKAQAYFDEQIAPGIANMRERGFEPRSFSYPFMSSQPAHDELIRQELPHIRAFFAHVTLIDDPADISLETIREHLEKIKKDKDIEVFLSHWILDKDFTSDNSTYKYRISKEKLIKIMDMVNELGLKFYTLEEAHNIYMNQ